MSRDQYENALGVGFTPQVTVDRRGAMTGAAAAGLVVASGLGSPRRAGAQGKPAELRMIGDPGPWARVLYDEIIPEWERETGIKVRAEILPTDPLRTRVQTEFNAGTAPYDLVFFSANWRGWIGRYMEDHASFLEHSGSPRLGDYRWDDVIPAAREAATSVGRLSGIPYRVTLAVIHYQPQVLEAAGVTAPPDSFETLREALVKCTAAGQPDRFGLGIFGQQASSITNSFEPFLFSAGGGYYEEGSFKILINSPESKDALRFLSELVHRDRVTPPEFTTWSFDEIVSGGRNDRYAMAVMLAPYGSLIASPPSRTAGKWAWMPMVGRQGGGGRTQLGGWSLGVPTSSGNKEWAFDLLLYATSPQQMRRSMRSGNMPPRESVLNDAEILKEYGWAAASAEALKTAVPAPSDNLWGTLEGRIRSSLSEVYLGRRSAEESLDAVANDWERAIRRAGLN